jgi:hypothetical protein
MQYHSVFTGIIKLLNKPDTALLNIYKTLICLTSRGHEAPATGRTEIPAG